jgi:hypothetical protein
MQRRLLSVRVFPIRPPVMISHPCSVPQSLLLTCLDGTRRGDDSSVHLPAVLVEASLDDFPSNDFSDSGTLSTRIRCSFTPVPRLLRDCHFQAVTKSSSKLSAIGCNSGRAIVMYSDVARTNAPWAVINANATNFSDGAMSTSSTPGSGSD